MNPLFSLLGIGNPAVAFSTAMPYSVGYQMTLEFGSKKASTFLRFPLLH